MSDLSAIINSCRVCRTANQDGDFENLLAISSSDGELTLSATGELYEELLGVQIDNTTIDCYPQYLCNSCDLQMRLFKKIKTKAMKTLETLRLNSCLNNDAIQIQTTENVPAPRFITQEEESLAEYLKIAEKQMPTLMENCINIHTTDVENVLQLKDEFCDSGLAIEKQFSIESVDSLQIEEQSDGNVSESEFTEEHLELELKTEENNYSEEVYLQDVDSNDSQSIEILDTLSMTSNQDNLEMYSIQIIEKDENIKNGKLDGRTVDEDNDAVSIYTDIHYLEDDVIANENNIKEKLPRKGRHKLSEINKIYECFLCDLLFTDSIEFFEHRKKQHSGKYPCSLCPRLLQTSDALRVHLQLHGGSSSYSYSCNLCPKTFNQKVHYEYHMNKHNNVRNFKCETCGKAFISKGDLSMHRRTHNRDRRYVCDICGKDFLIMQHVKMHRYSHFDRSIECKICHQKFVSPSTLRTHVQTIHENGPQFKCEICSKKFRRKHHLSAHLKIHNKLKSNGIKKQQQQQEEEIDDLRIAICDEQFQHQQDEYDDSQRQQQQQQQLVYIDSSSMYSISVIEGNNKFINNNETIVM